jgi:hypothetical protein
MALMRIRFRWPAVLVIALIVSASFCQRRTAQWQGRIVHEGRLSVVQNPATPLFVGESLVLSEDLAIGQDDGPDPFIFSSIVGLAVDDLGRIYAIDEGSAEVRVFSQEGLFERSIGRKGQGPGEYERPVFVQVDGRDKVIVGDYFGARLNFYSSEGTFIRQKHLPTPIVPIALDSRGSLIGMKILAPPPMGGKEIIQFDPEMRKSAIIAKEESGERGVFDIGKPSCHARLLPGGHVLWGNTGDYVLYELDSLGFCVRKITKAFLPRTMSRSEKEAYENRYAEPLKAGMKIRFRDYYPAFREIGVDDEGRIIIGTSEVDDPGTGVGSYDIFDAQGIYVAKVLTKTDLAGLSVWKKRNLYTVEKSPGGYPVIKRYRVRWIM